jgi:hypothetical protein
MKMEKIFFSETLASTDESTWHQNPEQQHHPHRHENFKSHTGYTTLLRFSDSFLSVLIFYSPLF